jgi:hypothetical protein
MFRPQMLTIFRLYNENLSIGYTCMCVGCRGGGVSARSLECGGGALDLGWLGTVYRQSTMPIYNYV